MDDSDRLDPATTSPGPIPAQRPVLDVGAHVTTLSGMRHGLGPAGLGRVACFGVRRSARTWTDPVLLTSHHVLHAHDGQPGDQVFSPDVADDGEELAIDPGSLAPVGEVAEHGLDGVHRYAFAGQAEADYHLDCATARLADATAKPSGRVAFRIGQVHPHDALPQRRRTVRLAGVEAGAAGDVIATHALVERADGTMCPGTIAIRSRSPQPFATEGDSGAMVVDRHGWAIGVLWGVDLHDPAVAYACHLLPALDRLDVVPSLRFSVSPPRAEER